MEGKEDCQAGHIVFQKYTLNSKKWSGQHDRQGYTSKITFPICHH